MLELPAEKDTAGSRATGEKRNGSNIEVNIVMVLVIEKHIYHGQYEWYWSHCGAQRLLGRFYLGTGGNPNYRSW